MGTHWAEDEPGVLAPIPEEEVSPSRINDDMSWLAAGMTASTSGSEDELIADCPEAVLLAQHAAGQGQLLQCQLYISREVCLMRERLQRLECKVHSDSGVHLEAGLSSIVEAGRRDAEQRRELAETFAAALQEERDARHGEIDELRAALVDMAQVCAQERPAEMVESPVSELTQDLARVGAAEVDRVSQAAGAEWSAFSASLRGLGARLLEDLSEQHTQAALDLADRHLEAARALDARSEEICQLGDSLRQEVVEIQAGLRTEVLDLVHMVLDDILKGHRDASDTLHGSMEMSAELKGEGTNSYHGSSVTVATCATASPLGERISLASGEFPAVHVAPEMAIPCAQELQARSEEEAVETIIVETMAEKPQGSAVPAHLLRAAARNGPVQLVSKVRPMARPVAKVWGLEFLKESGCLHSNSGGKAAF